MTIDTVVTWDQLAGFDLDSLVTWDNPLPGNLFLSNVLPANARAVVEIGFGADPNGDSSLWDWSDNTQYLMHAAAVKITQGRGDETSQSPPATLGLTLQNDGGRFSKYNPYSVNWPNVRANTPIRVTLDAGGGPGVQFIGEIYGWTPGWDITGKLPTTIVAAAGRLRRLTQKKTPVKSPLKHYHETFTSSGAPGFLPPTAYHPLEEGSLAVAGLPDAVSDPRVGNMVIASGSPNFGADGPAGATGSVHLATGDSLAANLPNVGSVNNWRLSFMVKPPTTGDFWPIHLVESGGLDWFISMTPTTTSSFPGSVTIWRNNADGTYAGNSTAVLLPGTTGNLWDGNWHNVIIEVVRVGGFLDAYVYVDGVETYNPTIMSSTTAGTTGLRSFSRETLNPQPPALFSTGIPVPGNCSISSVALWYPSNSIHDANAAVAATLAMNGYAGETAVNRLLRVCGEANIPMTIYGNHISGATIMGIQPITSITDILRDCEKADGGLLFDGFDLHATTTGVIIAGAGGGAGLGYYTRVYRYNLTASLTIDVGGRQLASPFTPVDDDQRTVNDFVASRTGGGSVEISDTDGGLGTDEIGTYDSSDTFNLATDNSLAGAAGWRVRGGTIGGFRYPTLSLDLAAVTALATPWLNVPKVGWRIDLINITGAAPEHPPETVSLIVEGWSMTFSLTAWTVTLNCSPFEANRVLTVGDTILGRIDTGGSEITTDVPAASTTVTVTTTGLKPWTTTAACPADFPFSCEMDGVRITVTGIAGATSPQTFTVDPSTVLKTLVAGRPVAVWRPAAIAR